MIMNKFAATILSLLLVASASAFVIPPSALHATVPSRGGAVDRLDMMVDPAGLIGSTAASVASAASLVLAETEPWVEPLRDVLGPFLNLLSFAMLCRVVISWYPMINVNEMPYSIVVWPTEPLLKTIRGAVPPAFGVDITPIVWLGLFTFLNEILLGQQGLLTMKIKYGV